MKRTLYCLGLMVGLTLPGLVQGQHEALRKTQGEEKMKTEESKVVGCTIERNDEKFLVEVLGDNRTTVTDQKGVVVTISYSSGNFNVRLPNGWGGWRPSIEQAVDYAANLCLEYRKQLNKDTAQKEMLDFVKKCKKNE